MWAQAGNVAVSIVLIIIYAYFFGQPSFNKYVKDGIIIIKNKERTSDMPPPRKFRYIIFYHVYNKGALLVIILYPLNPQSGGWKSENSYTQCTTKEGEQFIECIENNSYYNYGNNFNQSNSVEEKYYYATGRLYTMGQNLQAKSGAITYRSTASLRIPVDDSLKYVIYMLDPKLNILTYDPDMNKGTRKKEDRKIPHMHNLFFNLMTWSGPPPKCGIFQTFCFLRVP